MTRASGRAPRAQYDDRVFDDTTRIPFLTAVIAIAAVKRPGAAKEVLGYIGSFGKIHLVQQQGDSDPIQVTESELKGLS